MTAQPVAGWTEDPPVPRAGGPAGPAETPETAAALGAAGKGSAGLLAGEALVGQARERRLHHSSGMLSMVCCALSGHRPVLFGCAPQQSEGGGETRAAAEGPAAVAACASRRAGRCLQ